jgi:predicted nucleic acid-binding protein
LKTIRTYLDSGVLIAAWRGIDEVATEALAILEAENRQLSVSPFVKLEVLAKAIYHKQAEEISLYKTFFASCPIWANDLVSIVQVAQEKAGQYGLGALDALHVASALSVEAEELITTEKLTKPLHRVRELRVIGIADANDNEGK